jgi:hypothetical protein
MTIIGFCPLYHIREAKEKTPLSVIAGHAGSLTAKALTGAAQTY